MPTRRKIAPPSWNSESKGNNMLDEVLIPAVGLMDILYFHLFLLGCGHFLLSLFSLSLASIHCLLVFLIRHTTQD